MTPAVAAALLIAGCGSSSSSSSTGSQSAAGSNPASAPASGSVVLSTKSNKLGTILAAGSRKMTVYLFEADKGTSSSCSGACASVWPPVTGSATVSGAAMSADLGTTTRADGTTQITYKGHPLYFYARDGDDGDAYGQGLKSFGADWYVLAPSGKKIDES
jgi:predicted lipoprotein with Yx(FWY)xxD motif